MSKKLKVGLFSLTSCEGCILSILENKEKFMQLLSEVDLIDARLLKEKNPELPLDVAIVEGSVISKKEERDLKSIRKRSKYLISLGTCAGSGGVQAARNFLPKKQQKRILRSIEYQTKKKVAKIDLFINVDYYMRGCPINSEEFYSVINKLITNSKPKEPTAPVCFECKERGVLCKFFTKEGYCLGPITVGGCNAVCTANGDICWGCRGFTKDANIPALKNLLKSRGRSKKEIDSLFQLYNNWR